MKAQRGSRDITVLIL